MAAATTTVADGRSAAPANAVRRCTYNNPASTTSPRYITPLPPSVGCSALARLYLYITHLRYAERLLIPICLALWHSDTLVLWHSGILALWHSGTLTYWRCGTLAFWHSGTLALLRTLSQKWGEPLEVATIGLTRGPLKDLNTTHNNNTKKKTRMRLSQLAPALLLLAEKPTESKSLRRVRGIAFTILQQLATCIDTHAASLMVQSTAWIAASKSGGKQFRTSPISKAQMYAMVYSGEAR